MTQKMELVHAQLLSRVRYNMPKYSLRSYFFILIALLALMSVSKPASEKLKGAAIAALTPLLTSFLDAKEFISHTNLKNQEPSQREYICQLELENQLLKQEIQLLTTAYQRTADQNSDFCTFIVPARVIFRSTSSWYSSLWINVGEIDNQKISKKIIVKNSPVLLGDSVVGVIDYVGLRQSRVRLITDSGLTPSVRAVRECQKTQLSSEKETLYLAKGELHGSSGPMWRSHSNVLKGIGFNYDFSDEYGEARDLRTGKLVSQPNGTSISLLQVNDLLMTTGMDGTFPAGLKIAKVTSIHPLKEGDYYYELEAKPTAGDLENLSVVFIIPPLGFDPDDTPPFNWTIYTETSVSVY